MELVPELKELVEHFTKKYGPQLGDGVTAAAFAVDGRVRKVYAPVVPKEDIFKEAYMMTVVEREGIASPKVYGVFEEDGYLAIEMSFVPGHPLLMDVIGALMGDDRPGAEKLMRRCAEEQAKINLTKAEALPSYKDYARQLIENNPVLDEAEKEKILAILASLPDGAYICHGDLHPNNFMIDPETGTICAIDWPEIGKGVPACDAARTYINMQHPVMRLPEGPQLGDVYLDHYCEITGVTKEEVMAWMPVHAGMLVGYKKGVFGEVCRNYLP